jgi:hypothetical protein
LSSYLSQSFGLLVSAYPCTRVAFYNHRGTAEQWIKEGKAAVRWTRLSCHSFAANAVRLQLHALAYNLGTFLRTLALPEGVERWSLTTLREKLVKIGARVVSHGRYVTFQMAEVAVPRRLFAEVLWLIGRLRAPRLGHKGGSDRRGPETRGKVRLNGRKTASSGPAGVAIYREASFRAVRSTNWIAAQVPTGGQGPVDSGIRGMSVDLRSPSRYRCASGRGGGDRRQRVARRKPAAARPVAVATARPCREPAGTEAIGADNELGGNRGTKKMGEGAAPDPVLACWARHDRLRRRREPNRYYGGGYYGGPPGYYGCLITAVVRLRRYGATTASTARAATVDGRPRAHGELVAGPLRQHWIERSRQPR